ncbi:hypothetical protein BDV95DRAFT_601439 [Massariosphaeria phaeospora]|uniref:Uncharacterized protein n=1 Tax=Massariosphaeria phaeospora TaxID=100035 RepID=A0A7C8MMI0_9PLEO|nr:hypothetical protein BDV95DRAFT_601439 [Massariosphaeria phaeospora]
MLTLVANSYIATAGLVRKPGGNTHIASDIDRLFKESMNGILHNTTDSINQDMRDIMVGTVLGNIDLRTLIASGDYIEPHPDFFSALKSVTDRYQFAAAVNSLWTFDRPYILDVDAEMGCENDRRGPALNKVCLSERPGKSYWIYAIMQDEEHSKTNNAHIRAPTGLYRFRPDNNLDYNRDMHRITIEDIVRSSLWVHENHLEDAIRNMDATRIADMHRHASTNLGQVPGAFTIAVCRNPGGESITTTNQNDARNYPCMCGQFGWRPNEKGAWSPQNDETPEFLVRSGLIFSGEWSRSCKRDNKCDASKKIDWVFEGRFPRDIEIPEKSKHPFTECKKPRAHLTEVSGMEWLDLGGCWWCD